MQLPVIIPEPCHEQWDNMQARDNGRHCFACQKTVVDFTGWEPEAILSYLKTNQGTCGRFTVDQLQQAPLPLAPAVKDFSWWSSIMSSGLPTIGKIAAAVILLFHLASCDDSTQVPEYKPSDQNMATTSKPLIAGTVPDPDVRSDKEIIGDTIVPPVPQKPKSIKVPVKSPEPVLMGEPAMIEDSAVIAVPGPKPQIMGGPIMLVIPQEDSVRAIQK